MSAAIVADFRRLVIPDPGTARRGLLIHAAYVPLSLLMVLAYEKFDHVTQLQFAALLAGWLISNALCLLNFCLHNRPDLGPREVFGGRLATINAVVSFLIFIQALTIPSDAVLANVIVAALLGITSMAFWWAGNLAAASWLFFTLNWLRRFPVDHECPGCGYDLTGSTTRCPECGTAIRQANPLQRGASRTMPSKDS